MKPPKPKIKPRIMVGVMLKGVPQMIYAKDSHEIKVGMLEWYDTDEGMKNGWSVAPVLVTEPPKRRKK